VSDKRTTVDLSGAQLAIDGERHAVESGTLVAEVEYLRDAFGDAQGILASQISIDVELWEPPEDDSAAEHVCPTCDHGFTADGDAPVHCPKCGGSSCMTQAIRNALEDLETAADRAKSDFDAEAIRQSVATIREELGDG